VKAWTKFQEKSMDGPPFLVSTLVNRDCFAKTLLDSGCLSYGLISSAFATENNLQRIPISSRGLSGFDAPSYDKVTEVAVVSLDIDSHYEQRSFLYVVPRLHSYDMILGLPWITKQDARINGPKSECLIASTNTLVRNQANVLEQDNRIDVDCRPVSVKAFNMMTTKKRRPKIQVFAASLQDITKALQKSQKTRTDPRTKLPPQYWNYLDAFNPKNADEIAPLRGDGIDHKIDLVLEDGKEPTVPWGPLYKMSHDELLVLRKTLTEHLDKGFIRVSNSPAAAPVLFVRKPGGGLRFCVDYRALNKITRKDRYPLPLIHETLQRAGKAKWYTKLDVSQAFHRIRIAEGDEWKTAFRTRYGLYEWLVTPFGLANAPSTFQRYINWTLREYLDDFCSAYVDDVLIFSDKSVEEHEELVQKTLAKLRDAGLFLDIDKCEFSVKRTKYLGFILDVEKGVEMDPEKVKAILDWEPPKTVKAVRSFLGFANFYRTFIKDYSDTVRPLTELTHKERTFTWSDECQTVFEKLKQMFTTAPALVRFDTERQTVMETDSSGWCIGGALMQYDDDGLLRPCAFFSKKNAPAECNYEIYDKEMLAIVRCLEAWDPELRSVKSFEIRTDHKNLQYFTTVQKLTERQMRWSLILSRYNFIITYIQGKDNVQADALSRRPQDMPDDDADERLDYRTMQLLRLNSKNGKDQGLVKAFPVRRDEDHLTGPPIAVISPSGQGDSPDRQINQVGAPKLQDQWDHAEEQDSDLQQMKEAVRQGQRTFPTNLKLKVSISECSLTDDGKMMFRGRLWVPNDEKLRTKMTQDVHDSLLCGHPGRENTAQILSRQYFWPRMSQDVRRFVRNCDTCGRSKAWRDVRQGFLKPLPLPDRIWSEISIDFVVDLPMSNGCTNMVVITDRLGKGTICDGLVDITAETVARWFLRTFYRRHYLPKAIVSDRGTQFVGHLWTRICSLLGIVRRLSTAFHPETDGATERMNQTVETYLRMFVNYAQDDWEELLPYAELAINNRTATATKVSPFFLEHGYHAEPLDINESLSDEGNPLSPIQKADSIVRKLKEVQEWAQSTMATAQQTMEEVTNRHRQQAPSFKVGDKVWLSLKNIRTTRKSKKLDAKQAKYTVIEVVGTHSYRLNTPPGIHNVFHSQLLRQASDDPLPGQVRDDTQPGPEILGDDEEFAVERILDERYVRRGRKRQKKVLVKWKGYAQPSWEPYAALQDTAALDDWEVQRRQEGEGG
jgi:Reverse transcriptase (RNA-dependent DNA polymerase)/RNase H-like domain found in reverse transcriptase/Integrase zinc binding domain/Chromo (CHRromatin Organisation MOdifier) domain